MIKSFKSCFKTAFYTFLVLVLMGGFMFLRSFICFGFWQYSRGKEWFSKMKATKNTKNLLNDNSHSFVGLNF